MTEQQPPPPRYSLAPRQQMPVPVPRGSLSPMAYESGMDRTPAESLQFQDWVKILWARRWAIFGVFTLVMGAATLYSFKSTPVYQSTCTILIEPQQARVIHHTPIYDPTAGQNYHKTQYDILCSSRIARMTLNKMAEKDVENLPSLLKFMRSTDIIMLENSRLIAVAYESPDPEFATKAANMIVQSYIDDTLARQSGMSDSGIRTLKLKESELRPQVTAAQKEVDDFANKYSLEASTGHQKALSSQLGRLRTQYGDVKSQIIAAKSLADLRMALHKAKSVGSISSSLAADLAVSMDRFGAERRTDEALLSRLVGLPSGDLQILRDLQTRKVLIEANMAALSKRYKRDHPIVKRAQSELTYITGRIAQEIKRILDNVNNRNLALRTEEQALGNEIKRIEAQLRSLSQKVIQLRMLNKRAEMLGDQHVRILKRIEELSLDSTISPEQHNLHIIDRARRPSLPIRPRPVRDLQIGALLGLLLGLGLAFLLECLDNTLKSKEGVERALGLPVLGFVPPVDPAFDAPAEKDPSLLAELVALRNANSRVAESFRAIRTGLGFSLPGPADETRTLLITSSSSGEGKSFTAFNLALALSRAGQRVLLIDADMRKSKQHRLLGLETDRGLANTLAQQPDQVDLSAVMRTQLDLLDLLPAGPKPPNPAEMVSGESMRRLLRCAEQAYDWIIVDAPPVNAVADPAALLAHVPHALFVVRPFYTTLKAAQRAREVMAATPAHTVGVVLNNLDVPPSREDKYHRYTDYYYYHSYNNRSEPPPDLPAIEIEAVVPDMGTPFGTGGPNGKANGAAGPGEDAVIDVTEDGDVDTT